VRVSVSCEYVGFGSSSQFTRAELRFWYYDEGVAPQKDSMPRLSPHRRHVLGLALSLTVAGPARTARAAPVKRINVTVVVTDAETGKPINQARLTLQFEDPGGKVKLRHKLISYSAKTDAQGRYKFAEVPEGTVHLIVTDERHQTFGKDLDVDKANPVLEVKLKPPHPLL